MSLVQCHEAFDPGDHYLDLSYWDFIFYEILQMVVSVKEITSINVSWKKCIQDQISPSCSYKLKESK